MSCVLSRDFLRRSDYAELQHCLSSWYLIKGHIQSATEPMWLIDTHTLKLKFFQVCPEGQYAILSHVWQDDEVSFFEFKAWDGAETTRSGMVKILECCEKARDLSLAYAWVDTCCIDKSSSAELSEAINSMYQWYAQASTCFVYLFDVECEAARANWRRSRTLGDRWPKPLGYLPAFSNSRWFTRGWTLQELIAPHYVLFFDSSWNFLFNKAQIARDISVITKIPEQTLLGSQDIAETSVACRMSWAATRTTTRPEDLAYCLLGIFDINMPLLYGEGEKAFVRLQQAILTKTDDETIFAWSGVSVGGSGLLALSPAAFFGSGHMVPLSISSDRSAYSMTNKGLEINARLLLLSPETYLMPLLCSFSCSRDGVSGLERVGLILRKTRKKNTYTRARAHANEVHKSGDLAIVSRFPYDPFDARHVPRECLTSGICCTGSQNLIPWDWPDNDAVVHEAKIYVSAVSGYDFIMQNSLELHCFYTNARSSTAKCLYGGAKASCLPPDTGWLPAHECPILEIRNMVDGLDIHYDVSCSSSNAFGRIRIGFDFDLNPVCMFPASYRENPLLWEPPSPLSVALPPKAGEDWSQFPVLLEDCATYLIRGSSLQGLRSRFGVRLDSDEKNIVQVELSFRRQTHWRGRRIWEFQYREAFEDTTVSRLLDISTGNEEDQRTSSLTSHAIHQVPSQFPKV